MREHRQDARRTRSDTEVEAKPAKRELEVGKITGVMALDLTDAQLAEYEVDVGKVPRARVRQVDRRADTASVPERVDDILAKLDDIRGGQRLPAALAKRLAAELGADLSDVRLHTGGDAAEMAARLGARALAVGSDIYFGAGAYDPDSPAGVELIAHEVAHVAQQQRAAPIGQTRVSRPDDAHERDADRFASAFVVGAKTPAVASAPAMISRKPQTGADVWDEMFGESSKEVNKQARVAAPKGIILKAKPAPGAAAAAAKLDFDAAVTVTRTTTQDEVAKRWAYVSSGSGSGFIEERYLLIDPPEPSAHVHRVKTGETLGAIARDTYGAKIEEGNDERLYVQAIYEANKGKPGIYLTEVSIDTTDSITRSKDEVETLKIYKGVKAKADHALWVPSDSFVQALKQSGKITSGSTGLRPAWDAAVATLNPLPEAAKLQAGITVGVFEGAYQAIVDIFKGAIEMIKMAAEVMRLQLTGELMQKVMEVAQKIWDFISHLDVADLAKKLGDYIANKWNHATWFGRGEMIGEVVGYIAMNVLLALLTEGGSLAVELAEAAEAGSDIAKLVMAFVKVTDVAQNPLKLLEGAGKGVVIGEDAAKLRQGLKDAEKAREIEIHAAKKTGKDAEEAAEHIPDKGAMNTESLTLENESFSMDFLKDLSPKARGLVRKIEQLGFVRVSEISTKDLVAISQWFNREIGVLQSPYGKLRLVLGTRDGILAKSMKKGEVFVAHTHPVFNSKPSHFVKDLEKAGRNAEAVIDWGGTVTILDKTGVKNKVSPAGYIEPLENLEATFITKDGRIIGFAKVDIVDGADGIKGTVVSE